MKRDIHNSQQRFENWFERVNEYGIDGLNKSNSDWIVKHITDMRDGRNVAKGKKGKREYSTLNPRIVRLTSLFRLFETKGIKDTAQITEDQLHKCFNEITTGKADKIKDFKAWYHWLMRVNRKLYHQSNGKKGTILIDITEELVSERKENSFVYFTLEQLKKMMPYFSKEEQVRVLFMFDTIIRSPTELMNVKVSDIHDNFEQLTIRDEVAKTYGRTIKLLLCSEELKKYVQRNQLKSDDYLFNFDPSNFNKKLKQVAKKVLGTGMSKGGESYDKISLYDFRHSGACHWRLGAYKTKIDALMYRGSWANLEMLNYYTKKIGMRDSIEKSDLLIDVDKTELEKLKEKNSALLAKYDKLNNNIHKLATKRVKSDEILNALTKDPKSLKLLATALGKLGLVDKLMKI